MNNSIKLSSMASSYLELLKPSLNNCQSDKLIVGNINDKLCINKFCSIINFKYENIDFSNIDSAYLYIYLDSWHLPPIGQELQEHPQEDIPFFLSLTSPFITKTTNVINKIQITIVEKLADNHWNMENLLWNFYFVFISLVSFELFL